MQYLADGLTFLRLALIVPIALLVYLGNPEMLPMTVAAVLFALASITDYIDGYCARRFGSRSYGAMLDPIADKLLVSVLLLVFVAVDIISDWQLIPACIILSREIFVSGLREYLGQQQKTLPVVFLAKVKTACQLFALLTLFFAPLKPTAAPLAYGLLWTAAALTLYTGAHYLLQALKKV